MQSNQKLLYLLSNFDSMKIVIDNRKTDILYVDKENNHVIKDKETIKLVNAGNNSNIDIYIDIITGINKLNETESFVLKYVITNNGSVKRLTAINDIIKDIDKSVSTINRAIECLRIKGLVYITNAGEIKVSNSIKINIDNIVNARLLVIELNPEITSKPISII